MNRNHSAQPSPAPAIELRSLHRSYGSTHAVQGIDLTVSRGEIVALLGPNGAGKSTTIDMLLGLTRPDSGTVTLFGKTAHEAVTRGSVGAMLQTGGLIENLSVRELLTMMGSLYPHPRPVDDVLAVAGLQDVAGKRAAKLSGGQTQRVRFGIAMVSNPDLMVLDEPTASLDVLARHDFWQTMRAFAGTGKTVLFATHYLEEADEFADRIVLMAGGRIVADGSATQIKSVVNVRTIRATLPDVDSDALQALPGVAAADRRGESVVLTCNDSDATLRALLVAYPGAHDLEVRGAGLDEAFLQITGDGDTNDRDDMMNRQEASR
ncbi:MAG: ABC transporter ATP-binding protein [Candidatus Nanopelagicales bacterium]